MFLIFLSSNLPIHSPQWNCVVNLRKLGQQGKGDLLCQGLRKELSLSKKGTLEITDMAQILQIGHEKGKTDNRNYLVHLVPHPSVDCCIIQIYPKHPKTSQNIHVACVGSKSLVQIDTAGRQTCSPWQRFRFRPCSQVHPVSPSARPNQQKQPKKDQK